eukprot:442221-Hanusia_phi.AAC.1
MDTAAHPSTNVPAAPSPEARSLFALYECSISVEDSSGSASRIARFSATALPRTSSSEVARMTEQKDRMYIVRMMSGCRDSSGKTEPATLSASFSDPCSDDDGVSELEGVSERSGDGASRGLLAAGNGEADAAGAIATPGADRACTCDSGSLKPPR